MTEHENAKKFVLQVLDEEVDDSPDDISTNAQLAQKIVDRLTQAGLYLTCCPHCGKEL